MTQLGRRTGPKPVFTAEAVVTAALELGVARFTLADVAARLGVKSPALYRVISSREDLLCACLGRIARRAQRPDYPDTWPGMLRRFGNWLWDLLEEYPGLAETLMTVPWAHQAFGPSMAHTLTELEARGLERSDALLAMDFVADTVVGSHMVIEVMRAPLVETDATWASGLAAAQKRYREEGGRVPPEMAPDQSWVGRGLVDQKIELIITGLAAHLDRMSR